MQKVLDKLANVNLKENHNNQDDYCNLFETDRMPNCLELLFSLIPDSCLVCCKKSRKIVAMAKAREMLQEETNIISIVRRQRFMR